MNCPTKTKTIIFGGFVLVIPMQLGKCRGIFRRVRSSRVLHRYFPFDVCCCAQLAVLDNRFNRTVRFSALLIIGMNIRWIFI